MKKIIWVHEDALRDNHPVTLAAGDNALAVFIWDNEYFRTQGYSLKRLVFIAECLADMNVSLYKGSTRDILYELSQDAKIFTASTPNPAFRRIIEALDIDVVADRPLARLDKNADMGRFFRYWKKAGKSVMGRDGLPNGQEDLFS